MALQMRIAEVDLVELRPEQVATTGHVIRKVSPIKKQEGKEGRGVRRTKRKKKKTKHPPVCGGWGVWLFHFCASLPSPPFSSLFLFGLLFFLSVPCLVAIY